MFKKILRSALNLKIRCFYQKYYKYLLKKNNIKNTKVENEDKWIEKWSALGKANPIYFRLFSHYIGNNLNIIPEDICRNIIEPILDPLIHTQYYSDKNMFDKMFRPGTLPQTVLRKMDGFYYDKDYQRISINDTNSLYKWLNKTQINKIVVKPSVDTGSGVGVRLYEKRDDKWVDMGSGTELDVNTINKEYKDNIIIQECIEQSDDMALFNPTSVNTLRLTLYRSVKSDECHIPSSIFRIGKNGALIDNAHAGGGYVGIKSDGTLCNKVLNQYGDAITEFNGIDFTKERKIKNWDKVVDFAKYIGANIPHHRLLALDIMIDKDGAPRLIEFNCVAYGMWAFQFTTGPALGEYTDEIIEYCKNNLDKAEKLIRL